MKKIIVNPQNFETLISKIKSDSFHNLHILADFDRTLTKANYFGKKRPSFISVLRDEGYLGEEYSKEAHDLFNYYHPIEINPYISLEEKKKEMMIWWQKHQDLLVKSGIEEKHIQQIIDSNIIEFRDGVVEFLDFLSKNNIPIIIISANGLGGDSIKLFFQKNGVLSKNVFVISNFLVWGEDGKAISSHKKIIHVFNKDETLLKDFPEIHSQIENRKNIILLGDSIGDIGMAKQSKYQNLLKIGFFNENDEKLLEDYEKNYDMILTGDSDFKVWEEILK